MDLTLVSYVVLGILGLAGVVAAFRYKFKGTSIDELRAALATANDEIDVWKSKVERLESQIRQDEAVTQSLHVRVSALENENAILRGAIASGKELAPEFAQAIVKALQEHEARSQEQFRLELSKVEQRVRERHLALAKRLPSPVREAMEDVL